MAASPLQSLSLQINHSGFNRFLRRELIQGFQKAKQQILQRDENQCVYCGFTAPQHQCVVNKNGDYADNQINNLVTACPFCAQCLFLGDSLTQLGQNEFELIYLPELSQIELNHMLRGIYSASQGQWPVKSSAMLIFNAIKARAEPVSQMLGEEMHMMDSFVPFYQDMHAYDSKASERLIQPLRLFIPKSAVEKSIQYLLNEVFVG